MTLRRHHRSASSGSARAEEPGPRVTCSSTFDATTSLTQRAWRLDDLHEEGRAERARYNEVGHAEQKRADDLVEQIVAVLGHTHFPASGLLRPKDAARILGVPAWKLRRQIRNGTFPGVRVVNLLRVRKQDVLRALLAEWRIPFSPLPLPKGPKLALVPRRSKASSTPSSIS